MVRKGEVNPWAEDSASPHEEKLYVSEPVQEQAQERPPEYHAVASSSSLEGQQNQSQILPAPKIPGLPNFKFQSYVPPSSTISKDTQVITINDVSLCGPGCGPALAAFLKEQLSIPPKIEVRITGIHRQHSKGEVVDFDLRLGMMQYLIPQNSENSLNYTRFISNGSKDTKKIKNHSNMMAEDNISAWAEMFCNDKSYPRNFKITRTVVNWDTDYLLGRIYAMICGINYKGDIKVQFPQTFSQVIVNVPPPPNRSFSSAIRSTFAEPKKYEVESIWPYASKPPRDESTEPDAGGRRYVVRSEDGWWFDWKNAIKEAVIAKRRGWVGMDDLIEVLMLQSTTPNKSFSDWGKNDY